MDPRGTNNPKACERCRQRKVRCNGETPCQQRDCQRDASLCIYRVKARPRKTLRQRRAERAASEESRDVVRGTPADDEDRVVEPRKAAGAELYHSITLRHHAPQQSDSSQLFYGPSSNFAFLRQVHRTVLSDVPQIHQAEEAGQGLDMFVQRSIFFGTPPQISPESLPRPKPSALPIAVQEATECLDQFNESYQFKMPFLTKPELAELLRAVFSEHAERAVRPQSKAVLVAMLGLGALALGRTTVAETLILQAKHEVAIYDDAVTMQMLHFSLLVAEFQMNMGRPNSSYIHLGAACRKAFALGIHKETHVASSEQDLEVQRITVWVLYAHETWQALALGRKSDIKKKDISSPLPQHPSVVRLATLAGILENAVELIYERRCDSLKQLYTAAESVQTQLRKFAEEHNIPSCPTMSHPLRPFSVERLCLHNWYYHAILLTFRPFLIADCALRPTQDPHLRLEMWLRVARRYAVDAAQDSITFASNMLADSPSCRTVRYQAFFFECSCAVLLFDVLSHPSKYSYNLEFIQSALRSISSMGPGEPIPSVIKSVRRVLWAVEQSLARRQGSLSNPGPTAAQLTSLHADDHRTTNASAVAEVAAMPPLMAPVQDHVDQLPHIPGAPVPLSGGWEADCETVLSDAFSPWDFDVITTDLLNFFPLDMPMADPGSIVTSSISPGH